MLASVTSLSLLLSVTGPRVLLLPSLNYLNFFLNELPFIWVIVLLECMCTTCVLCPQRPEEGVWSLGLQLQMIVSCHVGSRDWIQVVRLGGRCFHSLNHLTNLSPNISYVHMGPLGPPCLNSPWTNCLALYTQDHSSHPCSWGQQQISCHFHYPLRTAGLFFLNDFSLMQPDYFLVFITFFPPTFMLTWSLIQLTSSVSSSYLFLITVQNMSTLIS